MNTRHEDTRLTKEYMQDKVLFMLNQLEPKELKKAYGLIQRLWIKQDTNKKG